MSKEDYVVYERASRDEERLFLQMAREAVNEVDEHSSWSKPRDPAKHHGGKPVTYELKPMLLILLLMNYHRKEYREVEAHLKNNRQLLKELGLKKAPSKSTIQRAAARISISHLVRLNDAITAKFKKHVAKA